MALLRPFYDLLDAYLMQLYSNPILTKSITSCVISTSGNFVAQYSSGAKSINRHTLLAFFLFGLFFGGIIPHYFYTYLELFVPGAVTSAVITKIVIERLLFAPAFTAFTLYILTCLEGKSHNEAFRQLKTVFSPILFANWKYISAIHLLNFCVVPPLLQVLIGNFVGFFWVVYLANKRNCRQEKKLK
ncbi:peroxisomal membrane protein 2-like [Chrysoperla carnea]|uniref:peroxisomal membrane protein 2-like n=1 Tax=Chrysoperla carnea TaxID=189513 RepID=UPI001D085611|nr:peroxisomal membrane protein 2-like [Chrysoperla carnea]